MTSPFFPQTKLRTEVSVYLAGPDVFRQNANDFFTYYKEFARSRGLILLSPFDSEAVLKQGEELSETIYKANIELLKKCTAVLANVEPFRGPSADAGTVFEIGYATALSKPVFAYNISRHHYKDRVYPLMSSAHGYIDGNDMSVENFSLFDNLMIPYSCKSSSYTMEEAIESCVQYFLALEE